VVEEPKYEYCTIREVRDGGANGAGYWVQLVAGLYPDSTDIYHYEAKGTGSNADTICAPPHSIAIEWAARSIAKKNGLRGEKSPALSKPMAGSARSTARMNIDDAGSDQCACDAGAFGLPRLGYGVSHNDDENHY
jgi:hypothetical protein